jgi:hypothetical protein
MGMESLRGGGAVRMRVSRVEARRRKQENQKVNADTFWVMRSENAARTLKTDGGTIWDDRRTV